MDFIPNVLYRFLSEASSTEGGDEAFPDSSGHSSFGVHVPYEELYYSVIFLTAIYVGGQLASRVLRMPDLVGEIVVGIVLGPPLLKDFVPYPEAWVLFGEIG